MKILKDFLTSALLLAIAGPLASAPAVAAIFTVGSPVGAGQCTHGTIQSAINAAAANPGADTVRLTRSLTYEPEANSVVTNQDLNIVGGFATCTQAASDGVPTIVSGGSTNANYVFRITTSNSAIVKLRHLTISGGEFGGIFFTGGGILQTIEMSISGNDDTGIVADGNSDSELIVDTGTVISNNNATSVFGNQVGGVKLLGSIEMTMIAPQTIISFNEGLYVGGLFVGPQAYAYIGSPGFGGVAAIYGNSGPGVAGWGGVLVQGVLKLFTSVPTAPVRVENNYGWYGGGIAITGENAKLCATNFIIDGNSSGVTSAITSFDGMVALNSPSQAGCARHPADVPCAPGTHCNSISDNYFVDIGQSGSTISLSGAAILVGNHFQMRGNTDEVVLRAGGGGDAIINHCLIADNVSTDRLMEFLGNGIDTLSLLFVQTCTVAGNQIGGSSVVHSSDYLYLFDSIIDQPGKPAQSFGGEPQNRILSQLLLTDAQGVSVGSTIVQANPQFIAPAEGDYHLSPISPAVDFAPEISGLDFDLDGNPRDIDLAEVANRNGPRDLGAYELQQYYIADRIMADSFELQ